MTTWEYCQLSSPAQGRDSVAFSHQQRASLVDDFRRHLGAGLANDSDRGFLHVNFNVTSPLTVVGYLGNEGWELVSHAVPTAGREYWTFKRPYQRSD